MEATTPQQSNVSPQPAFSFATKSSWEGFDVETMRIHSRARVVQSQLRANRLGRQNVALRHLLEFAQAHRRVEKQIAGGSKIIDLRAKREAHFDENRREASKDAQRIIEDRDRSALLDLRRRHEARVRQEREAEATIDIRAPYPLLRDAHPRSAIASRRWG